MESIGIPTVCLTSARDIVVRMQPPRAVFVDYPLGHTTGIPHQPDNQFAIVEAALKALMTMSSPGSIVELPFQWPAPDWRTAATNPENGDTRSSRSTEPQWQFDADRLAAHSNQ